MITMILIFFKKKKKENKIISYTNHVHDIYKKTIYRFELFRPVLGTINIAAPIHVGVLVKLS
jgi:hypothetical protein